MTPLSLQGPPLLQGAGQLRPLFSLPSLRPRWEGTVAPNFVSSFLLHPTVSCPLYSLPWPPYPAWVWHRHLMWPEGPSPAQVGSGLPLSSSLWRAGGAVLLPCGLATPPGVWRSFRAGLVVAKQTQCMKRLPRPPATIFVLEGPAGPSCAWHWGEEVQR